VLAWSVSSTLTARPPSTPSREAHHRRCGREVVEQRSGREAARLPEGGESPLPLGGHGAAVAPGAVSSAAVRGSSQATVTTSPARVEHVGEQLDQVERHPCLRRGARRRSSAAPPWAKIRCFGGAQRRRERERAHTAEQPLAGRLVSSPPPSLPPLPPRRSVRHAHRHERRQLPRLTRVADRLEEQAGSRRGERRRLHGAVEPAARVLGGGLNPADRDERPTIPAYLVPEEVAGDEAQEDELRQRSSCTSRPRRGCWRERLSVWRGRGSRAGR